jgi:hypothetical protein
MRTAYGAPRASPSTIGGHQSPDLVPAQQPQPKQPARRDRFVRLGRTNGERIYFADLARFAWPRKTEANLAFIAKVDARTARRWLAGHTEPPAAALGGILAEILMRYHQR